MFKKNFVVYRLLSCVYNITFWQEKFNKKFFTLINSKTVMYSMTEYVTQCSETNSLHLFE
jgi:hypothetical protein